VFSGASVPPPRCASTRAQGHGRCAVTVAPWAPSACAGRRPSSPRARPPCRRRP
jgi:hypothetical protein